MYSDKPNLSLRVLHIFEFNTGGFLSLPHLILKERIPPLKTESLGDQDKVVQRRLTVFHSDVSL